MPGIRDFEETLNLSDDRLALDFANTASWHAREQPEEHLKTYADLANWAERIGLLAGPKAAQLRAEAERRPAEAQAVVDRAIELREALYAVLVAHFRGVAPEAADLATLNEGLSQALARARLVATPQGFGWAWPAEPHELDQVLWPVLHAASDLLNSPELDRVGQCADDRGCGWLFLDTSKNHSRRWCSMNDCGNRAKARRHYANKRAS